MDPLIVALQDAARAGFFVSVGLTRDPVTEERVFDVSVTRAWLVAGEATDRLEPFSVMRPDLTDALGNALAIVGVEIGLDRAAKSKRLEET